MDKLTLSSLVKTESGEYVESHGLFYEDFVVGMIIKSAHGRTITETDNIWQSLINNNPHPLHFDREYGRNTEFGENLVSSLVTLSVVTSLSVSHTSINALANLGWDEVKLLSPVFCGDTLFSRTEILTKRVSKKNEARGIVTVKTSGLNQHGKTVITFSRSFLVPKRSISND